MEASKRGLPRPNGSPGAEIDKDITEVLAPYTEPTKGLTPQQLKSHYESFTNQEFPLKLSTKDILKYLLTIPNIGVYRNESNILRFFTIKIQEKVVKKPPEPIHVTEIGSAYSYHRSVSSDP